MKNINSAKKSIVALAGVVLVGFSCGLMADDKNYTAAKSQAEAAYDAEIEHCDTLSGNDKDVCVKGAKAKRTAAEADAKAQHKASDARKDANKDKLEADYKVAKERCDNFSGSEKDACQDRAKAKYNQ
ncbi:MAG TPA: hypothetical protein VLC91_00070 [Spongiibacteraceae bacterium]|nr:hypothetical protein [Spongiibacteraceae bacterium]